RDLNRSFPGTSRGSLAARLADVFMREIVEHCSHGIDLHTGSDHRRNLPQVRANLENEETRRCALAFGAPVIIDAHTRDGSLRDAASRRGKHVLLYEAGEPQRFNRDAVRTGVRGVLRVLEALEMVEPGTAPPPRVPPTIATTTRWVRARKGGLVRLEVDLGARVERGERLGVVADAFGADAAELKAPEPGIVIGRANNPVARQGDALVHLATVFEG
ncbi:MAG TPA: succinylglutamate desuccinylase/aspartoacylase family protein, partial [bacterium]|nr:succinylglutamate desuccinylase/aspartoacylase family protein [bacterium]